MPEIKKGENMKKIEMLIECPACEGTGVYSGIGESKDCAVVCYNCGGSGKYNYSYSYNEFTGRKTREGINRVYLNGYGYKIGTGKINFSGVGEIDMDKEGVSYEEFLDGKMPWHIKKLVCPMLADQGACHKIDGFVDRCNSFNDGWLGNIRECKNKDNKSECWEILKYKSKD